jgi:hypothetical protein
LRTQEFYKRVPKDLAGNLQFRRMMVEWGDRGEQEAHTIVEMCRRDYLFWLNTFGWTVDPKNCPDSPIRPFITYEFQDAVFLSCQDALGKEDRIVNKAREMGLSWGILSLFTHEWQFSEAQRLFMLFSRSEDYVDKANDMKSLMPKIDFLLRNQPRWLLPPGFQQKAPFRTHLHLWNPHTGSTIDGESATGNVGRGGRWTAVLYDENAFFKINDGFAARAAGESISDCKIYVSTPCGTNGAFYETWIRGEVTQIEIDWWQHPLKARGLYRYVNHELEILDKGYQFPADYKFKDDDKPFRSPWYDETERKALHPLQMAQEHEHSFHSSVARFFPESFMEIIQETVRPPDEHAHFNWVRPPIEWEHANSGNMRLWCPLEYGEYDYGRPPNGDYVVGADVAQGTGASNTVIAVFNRATGEKVGELASPWISPEQAGRLAVHIARWFHNAFLIWEATGPGRNFGQAVMRARYSNVYYSRNEDQEDAAESRRPGWWPVSSAREAGLGRLKEAVMKHALIERSADTEIDYRGYMFGNTGIYHERSQGGMDPSGAGTSHGDRVIANVVCLVAMQLMAAPTLEAKRKAPRGSIAWLWERADARERRANQGVGHGSLDYLTGRGY